MSFLRPDPPPPTIIAAPELPAPPPPVLAPPTSAPTGTKPGTKSQNKTFLGSEAIANPVGPSGQASGGKTLLGQ